MAEIRDVSFSEPELNNPVAVIGFPNIGLVGSILAAHLARCMDLPVVGGYMSPDLPPYAFVTDGRICPQVRILAGSPFSKKRGRSDKARPKIPKKDRRDVVIVTTEIAQKPDLFYYLALHIVNTLEQLGVKDIVCLEGICGVSSQAPLVCIPGSVRTASMAEKSGVDIMRDGIVRGISGAVMLESSLRGIDSMCLLVPASVQAPDPRAASRLLESLVTLYPSLYADPAALIREAEEIDRRMQEQVQIPDSNNIYG